MVALSLFRVREGGPPLFINQRWTLPDNWVNLGRPWSFIYFKSMLIRYYLYLRSSFKYWEFTMTSQRKLARMSKHEYNASIGTPFGNFMEFHQGKYIYCICLVNFPWPFLVFRRVDGMTTGISGTHRYRFSHRYGA